MNYGNLAFNSIIFGFPFFALHLFKCLKILQQPVHSLTEFTDNRKDTSEQCFDLGFDWPHNFIDDRQITIKILSSRIKRLAAMSHVLIHNSNKCVADIHFNSFLIKRSIHTKNVMMAFRSLTFCMAQYWDLEMRPRQTKASKRSSLFVGTHSPCERGAQPL